MSSAKADIRRWARGHQLDTLGAKASLAAARRENLAFHLTWARVRRAFGLG